MKIAVFVMSAAAKEIWWLPLIRLFFEKTLQPCRPFQRCFAKSICQGSGPNCDGDNHYKVAMIHFSGPICKGEANSDFERQTMLADSKGGLNSTLAISIFFWIKAAGFCNNWGMAAHVNVGSTPWVGVSITSPLLKMEGNQELGALKWVWLPAKQKMTVLKYANNWAKKA